MSVAAQLEPDATDRLLYELGSVLAKYRDTRERRQARVLVQAVRLSLSLEVCEALLRGEKVPASGLDPRWARAYGLRQ